MTSSALNEWNINPDAETLDYHLRQWKEPYRSTVAFAEFIRPFMATTKDVIDLGCGSGAATNYIAEQFPHAYVTGVEVSQALLAQRHANTKAYYSAGDMTNLTDMPVKGGGVISLQTLSWMPDIETPLDQICTKIKPKWMAFSSLFYDGEISCKIEVTEHTRPRWSYYNIYSIPRVEKFMKGRGYEMADAHPFTPHIDLPKPDNPDLMKTYSVRNSHGLRLQFSGPLYLPWWFLAFERIPPWE